VISIESEDELCVSTLPDAIVPSDLKHRVAEALAASGSGECKPQSHKRKRSTKAVTTPAKSTKATTDATPVNILRRQAAENSSVVATRSSAALGKMTQAAGVVALAKMQYGARLSCL